MDDDKHPLLAAIGPVIIEEGNARYHHRHDEDEIVARHVSERERESKWRRMIIIIFRRRERERKMPSMTVFRVVVITIVLVLFGALLLSFVLEQPRDRIVNSPSPQQPQQQQQQQQPHAPTPDAPTTEPCSTTVVVVDSPPCVSAASSGNDEPPSPPSSTCLLRASVEVALQGRNEALLHPARTRLLCPLIGPDNCTRAGPVRGCMPHHPAFSPYLELGRAWHGLYDGRYVRDFLGLRTDATYNCPNARYGRHHLSYVIPCNEHRAYGLLGQTPLYYPGPFPISDEEYWEWIDCLEAVNAAVAARRPFVIMELGARYGPWIARGVQAYRLLAGRDAPWKAIGVEGDGIGYQWMQAHMALNDIASSPSRTTVLRLLHAAVGVRDGDVVELSWEGGGYRVKTLSLPTLLANYTSVDLLDMDIQGVELDACRAPGAMEALSRKVRRIHIGTHSHEIHRGLVQLFTSSSANGDWVVAYSHLGQHNVDLWGGLEETAWGRMHFNDGVLSLVNTRLA